MDIYKHPVPGQCVHTPIPHLSPTFSAATVTETTSCVTREVPPSQRTRTPKRRQIPQNTRSPHPRHHHPHSVIRVTPTNNPRHLHSANSPFTKGKLPAAHLSPIARFIRNGHPKWASPAFLPLVPSVCSRIRFAPHRADRRILPPPAEQPTHPPTRDSRRQERGTQVGRRSGHPRRSG
jgi:hypothetical protein